MYGDELNIIRSKIAKFCAFRERATKEVIMRLRTYDLKEEDISIIIAEMKKEGFLDDGRFARLYAGGKFRIKKWGKLKIKRELRLKGVSDEDINAGLAEIEGQTYLETLESLAVRKFEALKEKNLYIRKNKVATYLVSKGYESELIRGVLNKLN